MALVGGEMALVGGKMGLGRQQTGVGVGPSAPGKHGLVFGLDGPPVATEQPMVVPWLNLRHAGAVTLLASPLLSYRNAC